MDGMQNVILFGRTGYGKSSIANMLIQGDIYQDNNVFTVNDGTEGETVNINSSCTEKYQVFDMVGLGEPPSHSVSHNEAVKKARDYFSKCQVPLNYIFYVQRKGRITEDDVKMFKVFKEIFKEGETNFIIIITHCNPEWVENTEYVKTISRDFGDYPIIPVDFPLADRGEDYVIVSYQRSKRAQSLRLLEDTLSNLNYKGINLEILSSSQNVEKDASKVISIIPVVGSTYQLIASGVYYVLNKPENAKERLIDGTVGLVIDAASVGVGGLTKSISIAIAKDAVERISYRVGKEIKKIYFSSDPNK